MHNVTYVVMSYAIPAHELFHSIDLQKIWPQTCTFNVHLEFVSMNSGAKEHCIKE